MNNKKLPRHIAIIMDGNRRWARKKKIPALFGHRKGANTLSKVVNSCVDLGIKTLTVYAFSTENWKRSDVEVDALMKMISYYLNRQINNMLINGVRFHTIGDLNKLPSEVQNKLNEAKKLTENGSKLDFVLALNYGGRDEIVRALKKAVEDIDKKKLKLSDIDESLFSQYLDTASFGDPDLLIRTSGENRISNFLLWQLSYSEIFVTDVLWPDFEQKHLEEAIHDYQKINRRLGGK